MKRSQIDLDHDIIISQVRFRRWQDDDVTRQMFKELLQESDDSINMETSEFKSIEEIAIKAIQNQNVREFVDRLLTWTPVSLEIEED